MLSPATGTCFVFITLAVLTKSEDELYTATEATLKRTLDALDSGLDFMESEYKHVNLDAAIGTRLVEGKLSHLYYFIKASYL